MKLARVKLHDGVWLARLEDESAVLLAVESDHPARDALREALDEGTDLRTTGRTAALDGVELLAPLRSPSKILAIGLNYADHARETGADTPPAPLIFAKAPSAIVGPGHSIRFRATDTDHVDYEAELAVVIGTRLTAPVQDPLRHVVGYTVCNDISARDAQFGDGQWVRGKSFDTFCPLGPWITTVDEIEDPQQLRITCRIGTETLQDSNTSEMIFGAAEIVNYIARFMTLEPGDVIATGTPAGVGFTREPPRFLHDGETVTCWIQNVGELSNPVELLEDSPP
jgi:2-keto-4-pentenoate hydratase/2-oxohepta-3-ene-1,7-dioic acid hydratase in catechol pathway